MVLGELNPVPKIRGHNCDTCGTYFEREWYKYKSKIGDNKFYCSDKCSRASKRNGEYRDCSQCKKRFYTSFSRNKVFCSRRCSDLSMADNPRKNFIGSADNRGIKNGQYKHGKYVGKGRSGGDQSKLKVRKVIVEYDGHWCLLCGKPGPGLHLHRVVYGSQGGKYVVGNCVQLCAEHHEEVHRSKRKWFPILMNHIEERKERITNTLEE